jgi:pyruvate formate lyase activating enzyme
MLEGVILNIMRFSINDGPGIRTTVFLKGCPLHCAWCHNPESITTEPMVWLYPERCLHCGACVERCEQQALAMQDGLPVRDMDRCISCGECVQVCHAEARQQVGRRMTVDELMADIMADRLFFEESKGGVTFSGGEPLRQPDFLLAGLQACQARYIHTAVDTTGCVREEELLRISDAVDLFLYDIKMMDDSKHRHYTGLSNRLLLSNVKALDRWGKEIIIRIPVIPGLNDSREDFAAVGRFLQPLSHVQQVQLLPYHKTGIHKHSRLEWEYSLADIEPPSAEHMQARKEWLSDFVSHVVIGGQ